MLVLFIIANLTAGGYCDKLKLIDVDYEKLVVLVQRAIFYKLLYC